MIQAQDPQPGDNWLDAFGASLSAMGWVDLTALAILLVFFVLGFFRGLIWQLSRIAILLIAYFAAITFGRDLSKVTASWFDPVIETNLPLYVAVFLIFMGTLICVSIAAHFLQKMVESSGFTFANRFGGGLCGVATGGLVVLAMLTVIQMINASYGFGAGIAQAARSSRSMQVGHDVLRSAERVTPQGWQDVMGRWLLLLGEEKDGSKTDSGKPKAPGQGNLVLPPEHASPDRPQQGRAQPGQQERAMQGKPGPATVERKRIDAPPPGQGALR